MDLILQTEAQGKVDFVKIDVEGMHVEVLSGAEQMLAKARPVIWIELRKFKNEYAAADEIFSRHDYQMLLQLGPHDYLFGPAS